MNRFSLAGARHMNLFPSIRKLIALLLLAASGWVYAATNVIGPADGTFETDLSGATTTGDVLLTDSLGILKPTQGTQALLMTTAPDAGTSPGDATVSTVLIENFTIGAEYATLRMSYTFLTNEPDPSFANDIFESTLVLVTAGGEEILLSSDTFDDFSEAPWTGFDLQSGFRTMVGDVSGVAGTGDTVSLELRIADVGDGRRDSGVFIDDLRLVEPGVPTALVAEPYVQIEPGETFRFDGSGSSDDVGVASYDWNFANNFIGFGPIIDFDQYNEVGVYQGTLTVTDDDGNSDTTSFTVVVGDANSAPQIVSEGNGYASEGVPYTYQIFVLDEQIPLGDVITYSLDAGPAGMSIDENTGLVTWEPPVGGDNTYEVSVSVTDSEGAGDAQTYTIAIGPEVYVAAIGDGGQIWTARSTGAEFDQFGLFMDVHGSSRSRAVAIADFDGDRDFDLMSGERTAANPNLALYLHRRENGAFLPPIDLGRFDIADPSYTMGMTAGDFDDDGDQDLVVSTNTARTILVENTGPLRIQEVDFFASNFETGGVEAWGGAADQTGFEVDSSTAANGIYSMRVFATNTGSDLTIDVNPSDWFFTRGYKMRFNYRIPADVPVGMLFNVSGIGWVQLGGTTTADPGPYPQAAAPVTLIDDDTWRTAEIDLYTLIRSISPTASFISEFEWWTADNGQPGDQFWFDDFQIVRDEMISGFAPTQLPDTGSAGRDVDAGDANNDGVLDFVRAKSNGDLHLYFGDGTGNFTASGVIADAVNDSYGVVLDDFDNDGNDDIISNYNGTGDHYFFKGNGNGTFQAGQYLPNLDIANYASIGARDFDGDGNVDIVMSTYTSRQMRFNRGNGNGTFQPGTVIGTAINSNVLGVAVPEGRTVGRPYSIATADQDSVSEGGTVNFDGSESYDDGSIVDYFWDFGNGETASGLTASSSFANEGIYTVVLAVSDDEGNVDRSQLLISATGAPPVADPGGPYAFDETQAIQSRWRVGFDATDSFDAETSIIAYEWDFDASNGISVNAKGVRPRWTYTAPGVYTITLTVYDEAGQSASATTTVTITPNDPPTAELAGPSSLDENNASLAAYTGWYNAENSTDDIGLAQYSIEFGDGSPSQTFRPMSDNFDDGNFDEWLVNSGTWSVSNQEVLQTATGNAWRWLQDRNRVYQDFQLEVDFKALSTGGDGYVGFVFRNANGAGSRNSFLLYSLDSWDEWSFYDWQTDTTLLRGGSGFDENIWYHLRLVVMGDTMQLYVTPEGGTESLAFETTSDAHPRGGIGLLTYNQIVRFDNVKVTPLDNLWTQSGQTLQDLVNTYATAGSYDISLTVTDHANQSDTDVLTVSAAPNAPPIADAGGPYLINEGQALNSQWTLTLDASGSTDDVGVERYLVDWGDGTSSVEGVSNGTQTSYFVTGTDLYGFDTLESDGNLYRVVATQDNTLVELLNLETGLVINSTTLNRFQTWNSVSPGNGIYYKIRASKPVSAYFTDTAEHAAFWPSLDGTPVGREFYGYLDINGGVWAFAYEDALLTIYRTNGTVLLTRAIRAGQYANLGSTAGVFRIVSSGRVSIQTQGISGFTTVPSSSGDGTGQLFYFATDGWGGGSIAVFAQEAANVQVFDMDTDELLYEPVIAAGSVWYQENTGERRVRVVSDADVEVWAGDNEAAGITGLGDDLSFAGGRQGTEFVLHELNAGFVVFATADGTEVNIDGALVATLDTDEYLPVAPADLGPANAHRITTSQPVVIQTRGNANAFNDFGTYLGGTSMRHRYGTTGEYTISVTAIDRAGQTSTDTTTVEVEANDFPVPAIDAPAEADESFAAGGLWSVDFDATGSSDDFGISTYEWDFGDGNTGSGAQITHAYDATGTFEVSLTVTDHAGQSVTTTQNVIVSLGAPPVADAGGPYVLGEESAKFGDWVVEFDGTGSTDDAGIFDYLWDFGPILLDDFNNDGPLDGKRWTSPGLTTSGAVLTVTGTGAWGLMGFFADERISRADGVEITTRVTDPDGNSNMMWGLFPANPSNYHYLQMPHAIYMNNGRFFVFENNSNRFSGPTYTRGLTWDLRIVLGETGARYYYREAGTTDWNELGPVPSLASTQSNLRVGASILTGAWPYDNPTVNPLLLDGPIVTRTYQEPVSSVPVSLTVRDNALQANTDSTNLTLEVGDPPVADAGDALTAEVGSFVNFNGSASSDDNAIESYVWNFGETTGGPEGAGGTASANLPYLGKGPTPRHFYKQTGTYNVTLDVYDTLGQTDSDTTTVDVIVGDAPVAAASIARAGAAGGPPVYFDAGGSSDDFGIVEYRWDFDADLDSDGDGDPTNDLQGVGKTPFHVYRNPTGGPTDSPTYSETFDTPLDSGEFAQAGATVNVGDGEVELAGCCGWGTRYLMSLNDYDRGGFSFRGQVRLPVSEGHNMMWGVKDTSASTSFSALQHAIYFNNGTLRIYERGSSRGAVSNFTYQAGVLYDVRVDPEEVGARYYMRVANSGDPWVELTGYSPLPNNNFGPLRIHAVATAGTWRFDNFEVIIPADRTAILTVVDGAGQTSTTQVTVPVAEQLPPHVITVPWVAFDPLVPHETYNGKSIHLKGIVRDKDAVSYQWDFGDGTQTGVINITDPFDLSVTHTYPSVPNGTPFTATLTVTDAEGNQGSATYPVIVKPQNLTTEINVAIDEGLWYLHTEQTRATAEGWPTGFWTSNARASATASALQAFEINGHLETVDHQLSPYAETVQRGLRQLFRDLGTVSIASQTYGEPDTNNNGIGIQTGVSGSGNEPIYQGGQVMDAIASSGSPLTVAVTGADGIKGRRYFDILTDMADAFAWGQTEQGSGGGWRYTWNNSIDNSAAQWGAIGLLAAQDIFGIPYPKWVEERNIVWLNNSYTGAGFGYTTGGSSAAGTPSGMVQLIMDELPTFDYRWKTSEQWVANNWTSQYIITPNNRPYYPYYALTKAMRLAQPEAVETFAANGFDWFRDPELGLARTLIDDQLPNGQFPGTTWIRDQLRSAWGVIILSRTLFVQPPVADAGRDRVWGVDIPLEFDGSNSFHLDPFRDIVKYEWDFDGDGIFDFESDQPLATHTYSLNDYPENTLPVTLNARLRVTDNNIPPLTDNDTAEIIIAIPPHPPVAEAGGPYTCTAGLPCELDGSGSFDIDPTDFIARYEWDLDGFPFDYTGPTGVNPTPSFDEGIYNISVRVYDNGVLNDLDGDGEVDENERLTDVDFATVTAVPNLAPLANANGPYTVDEGSVVTLNSAGSSDPNGDPLTFEWDLDNDAAFDDALGASPNYLGEDDGDYPIALRVTDGLLSDTATSTVTVNNVAPTVDAGFDTDIIEGGTVNFSGTFSDPGTLDTHTIEWDFGDGNTVTGSLTPSHTYPQNGTFDVTLTVTDDDGGVGTDTLEVTVDNAAPVVEAGADQTEVLFGATVSLDPASFTDLGVEDTHVSSIDWGDGTVEAGALTQGAGSGSVDGSHVYAVDGTYVVTVNVTDNFGATGSDTLTVIVGNPAPVVNAGPDATIQVNDTFVSSGSFTDADVDPWTATVNYGDGSGDQVLALNPDQTFDLSHTYTSTGSFVVTVTVNDNDGGVGVDTAVVTVNLSPNNPPVVEAGPDASIDEGDTFVGSGSFSDADVDDTWAATVNYGDGSPAQVLPLNPDNTFALSHTYVDDGNYTVTVTVNDNAGGSGSDTLTVTVNNVAPAVDAGPDASIQAGGTFASAGSFTDPGADVWSATVDYDDGAGPQPLTLNGDKTFALNHTYADAGDYTVTVTVSDDDGGQGSDTVTVTVEATPNTPPIVEVGEDATIDEGDTFVQNGSFTDPDVDDTWSATVDYGDGSGVQPLALDSAAQTFLLSHTYADNNVYTVTVTVNDNAGGSGSDTLQVTVLNVAPTVDAGPDQISNEGDLVNFSGSFTDPGTLDTHTIAWDFGDGNGTVGTLTPSHTYAEDGVYTVTLTVTDDDGGIGSDTLTVTVNNVAPAVDAGPDQTSNEGDLVGFSGSFSDPGVLDTHTIAWDFGDGSNATGSLTPSHTYADNGEYTVTLTVTDDDGGVGSDTLTVTVNNVAPVVDAGPDATVQLGDGFISSGSFSDPGADTWTATVDYGEGDGPQALALNPDRTFDLDHTYADDGIYTVTVAVTDDDGGVGSDTATVTVEATPNSAPVVDAGPDASIDEGSTFSSGGTFTDPDVDNTWDATVDYGDGSSLQALTLNADKSFSLNHVYADNGVYTVTVTVNDNAGGSGSDTAQVTVNNVAPAVDAGPDAAIDEGSAFVSAGSFTDPGADTWIATVDYGDGSGVQALALNADGTFDLSHTYVDDGAYTVTVTVTDDDGGVGTDTASVSVGNVPPVVDAGPDAAIDEGDTFVSVGSFADPGADTWTATVNYGDGSGVQALPLNANGTFALSHTYVDNGAYTVTVIVSDDDGGVGIDTALVNVANVAPTVEAGPDASIGEGEVFDSAGFFTDPGADTWTATVDYGDGGGAQPLALNADKTFALNHTYVSEGTYTITVTVSDDDGGTGSDTASVTVEAEVVVEPPTDLTARPKSTKVQLVWTHNGSDSYNVYRSTTQGGPYELIANTTSTYSTYLDEGLTDGVTYYYVVTSVVNGVESATSVEVGATPMGRTRSRGR